MDHTLLPDNIEDPGRDDKPAHDSVQETKTEDTFAFNAESETAQEYFGREMVFPLYGFLRPSINYYPSNLILHIY